MDEQRSSPRSELKFLERLSIEELEALLRSGGDPTDMEALFDAVVEEVVAREEKDPTGRLPDVDAAWDELQMMYNSLDRIPLEEEGALPDLAHSSEALAAQAGDKPKRISIRRIVRTVAVMAAVIALCLGLMVGAQAAGADVFGALARWTDETFHFETRAANLDNNNKLYASIQETLDAQESLGQYAPRWYPEGSTITDVQIFQDDLGVSVQISLADGDGDLFYINVDRYYQNTYIDSQTFEIDAEHVEEYLSKGKTYFILSNSENNAAVWSDGSVMQTIWGQLDSNCIKRIIDSVGG